MTISILYFAAVRDLVGLAEEKLELPSAVTNVASLAAHLVAIHPELDGRLGPVRFARNEAFASLTEPVADGDVVALIPPVAGG